MAESYVELIEELTVLVEKLEKIGFGSDTETVEHNGKIRNSIAAEIKSKFSAIQAMVQGRSAFQTKAQLDSSGAPVADSNGQFPLAEVWNDSDQHNGLYGWSGSAWVKSPYDLKRYVDDQADVIFSTGESSQSLTDSVKNLNYGVVEIPETVTQPLSSDWGSSTGLRGWAGVFRVSVIRKIQDIQLHLTETDAMNSLNVRIYRRPVYSGHTAAPAVVGSDPVVFQNTYDLSAHAGVSSGDWENFSLGISMMAIPGFYYIVEYTSDTDAMQNAPMGARSGWTRAPYSSVDDPVMSGFYQLPNGTWSRYVPGNARAIALRVLADEGELKSIVDANKSADVTHSIKQFLGNDNVLLSSDSTNDSIAHSDWKGADFTSWMTFKTFGSDDVVDVIRCKLNNAPSDSNAGAILDTRSVAVAVYEDQPGVMNKNQFFSSPCVFRKTFPVELSSSGDIFDFYIGLNVSKGKEYAISLSAFDDSGQRSALGIASCKHPEIPVGDRRLGAYQQVGQKEDSYIIPSSDSMPDIKTAKIRPYVTKEKIDQITDSLVLSDKILYERPWVGNGWNSVASGEVYFDRWGVGYAPENTLKADRVSFYLSGLASLSGFNFKIYERPEGGDWNVFPGAGSDDVVVFDRDYKNGDLPAPDDAWFESVFDISSVGEFKKGKLYIFAFNTESYGGGLGMAQSSKDFSESDAWQRGWYSLSSNSAWVRVGGVSSISYKLLSKRYEDKGSKFVVSAHSDLSCAGVSVDGLVVRISELNIDRINIPKNISDISITLDQPARTTVDRMDYALVYENESRAFYHDAQYLPYRFIENVSVFRKSDGEELKDGIDYEVLSDSGKIIGLKDIPSINVEISFDGYESRYDIIECDVFTGEVSVSKGFSRSHDPEEYMPLVSSGKIPLYYVYVFGNNCELIPVYNWANGFIDGSENEWLGRNLSNRKSLRHVFAKLQQKENIRIAGYGDSITAQGGGVWDSPNGVTRDVDSYYSDYPDDTKQSWERFDHGDGLGQVHVHHGWNWHLKSVLDDSFGVDVIYDNWGIGGTRSGNYKSSENGRGGLNSERLNTMLASNPDLVVIGFGMNEIGSSETSANVAEIARRCQAAGADVIIMGCPRISVLGGRASVEQWRTTNDRLWLAAQETGSAFVSTTAIADQSRLGGIALSAMSMCNANRYNHPGPYELKKYGEALADLFI